MLEKICAVVVTYNRKDLLINCLNALLEQSRPLEAIFIIDNLSSDGTPEKLLEKGFVDNLPPENLLAIYEAEKILNNNVSIDTDDSIESGKLKAKHAVKIHYIRMNENTGGAGGFHEGVKRGYEAGYDWVWLMDDDGYPDFNCLDQLLKHKKNNNFLNPLVIDINNNLKLSFGFYSDLNNKRISTVKEANKYSQENLIENSVNPFNGTLVTRILIQKIGYPKKELFIWGDEVDYFLKAKKNELGIATVVSALHKHPKGRVQNSGIFFNNFSVAYNENKLKDYCLFRNQAYLLKNHHSIFLFLKPLIKYTWFFVITRKLNINGLLFYLSASFDGFANIWGKEKQFLKG